MKNENIAVRPTLQTSALSPYRDTIHRLLLFSMIPSIVDSITHRTRFWLLRLILMFTTAVILFGQAAMMSEGLYSTEDNASWAITSPHVASHRLGLGEGPSTRYQQFIADCNAASLRDQLRDGLTEPDLDPETCTLEDQVRQERNRHQPAGVYNYTKSGYLKLQAPEELMSTVRHFYFTNRHLAQDEWPNVHSHQNTWEAASKLIRLEDATMTGGGKHLTEQIADATLASIQEWTGLTNVRSTSVYGIREYHRGSILAPHVDRLPLVVSAILNVHQEGIEQAWPLEVYGHDGMAHNVTLQPGEMLLYESHSIIHGRPFPFQGDIYANVFVHFEPVYDDADVMASPPYLVPGSIWEGRWREDQIENWALQATLEGDAEWLDVLSDAVGWQSLLDVSDENGWGLIHEAVRAGHLEVVQRLLENGADVNLQTDHKQRPLSISLDYWGEDHSMTQLLLNHIADGAAEDDEQDL